MPDLNAFNWKGLNGIGREWTGLDSTNWIGPDYTLVDWTGWTALERTRLDGSALHWTGLS